MVLTDGIRTRPSVNYNVTANYSGHAMVRHQESIPKHSLAQIVKQAAEQGEARSTATPADVTFSPPQTGLVMNSARSQVC